MRTILAAFCLSLCCATSSFAQCYGDAARAFGCSVSRGQEASLETFGESRNQVVPDYGYARSMSYNDLFSEQETRGYYRRIYNQWRNNRWSEQAFRDSMNYGAQPIRSFGNLPFARPRF